MTNPIDKGLDRAIKEIEAIGKWDLEKFKTDEANKMLERLVIEIGANGGRFVGEGNVVFQPLVTYYAEKIKELFTSYKINDYDR